MTKKTRPSSKTEKSKANFSGRVSSKSIKHNRLSGGRLIIFSLIFSMIGGYAVYKSLAAEPGYINSTYGVITGTVRDAEDTPVAGATVSVSVNGAKRIYTTSSKGLYYIPALPNGNYSLNVSAKKYAVNTVSSNAVIGKITVKDVNLRSEQL